MGQWIDNMRQIAGFGTLGKDSGLHRRSYQNVSEKILLYYTKMELALDKVVTCHSHMS